MKKMNTEETRQVNGGRWKCQTCGYVNLTYANAVIHFTNMLKKGLYHYGSYWIW